MVCSALALLLAAPAAALAQGDPADAFAALFPSPSGLNVDAALEVDLGLAPNLPILGNADFRVALDGMVASCGAISASLPVAFASTVPTEGGLIAGAGCGPDLLGELLIGLDSAVALPVLGLGPKGETVEFGLAIPDVPELAGLEVFVQAAYVALDSLPPVVLTNRVDLTLGVAPKSLGTDECADAVALPLGLTSGTTLGATPSAVAPDCNLGGGVGPDVWYRFDAEQSGRLNVAACNVEFDAVVGVFEGACGGLVQIACADFGCSGAQGAWLDVDVVAGQTYSISVAGSPTGSAPSGGFELILTLDTVDFPDACDQAQPIEEGVLTGSNVGYTDDGYLPCFIGADRWYRYQASGDGSLVVSSCVPVGFSSLELSLAAYEDCSGEGLPLACSTLKCFSMGGFGAELEFPVTAGRTYLVQLGGDEEGFEGPFVGSYGVLVELR
ncbi:MAG: hypothetical protein AAFZ65_12875 [Planctomycetota bacterium]